mmetsp:Transcript_44074/g.80517  ORF Transcript_44074/g.80517 Transcript_44074/m.80517 type:complete len:197 (+) Transcript_44074:92-682(+)
MARAFAAACVAVAFQVAAATGIAETCSSTEAAALVQVGAGTLAKVHLPRHYKPVVRLLEDVAFSSNFSNFSNYSNVTTTTAPVQAAAPATQVVIPIAPFGKEDTAQELQDLAARTQDTLVDAVENAQVAEIKRAVFRSLTRLRAAQIKEFDTIARLETQALDEYNDNHHYRAENPLDYLHNAEPEVEEDKYTSFHD